MRDLKKIFLNAFKNLENVFGQKVKYLTVKGWIHGSGEWSSTEKHTPAVPHMQANFQSQVRRTMVRNQTHPTHPHQFISKVKKRRAATQMTRDSCHDPERSKRCRKSAGRLLRRKAASRQKRSCQSVEVQFLFHVIPLPLGQAVKPVPRHLKQSAELLVVQVNLGKSQTACCYALRPRCWSTVEHSQCRGTSGTACMHLNSI